MVQVRAAYSSAHYAYVKSKSVLKGLATGVDTWETFNFPSSRPSHLVEWVQFGKLLPGLRDLANQAPKWALLLPLGAPLWVATYGMLVDKQRYTVKKKITGFTKPKLTSFEESTGFEE